MAMLGDILAAARRSAPEVERWLAQADPGLAARLDAAARAEGETPAVWLRVAVADFNRFASEEDWATLVSRLRDAEAPGAACLLAMLDWRLAQSPVIPAEGPAR
jgi:hypothetical protein